MGRTKLQIHVNTLDQMLATLEELETNANDDRLLEVLRLTVMELVDAVTELSGLTPEEF